MEKQVKQSNLCAQIGFLLTLLNLTVSSAFIITGSKFYLLIFSTVTAMSSLILCLCGNTNSKKTGRGKILSVTGIVVNVAILAVAAAFFGWMIFLRSSSNV